MAHPNFLDAPGSAHYAITPSDSVNLPTPFRALYVGTSGNVSIVDLYGTPVTYVGAVGTIPMRGIRVNATGTTASNIVGMY